MLMLRYSRIKKQESAMEKNNLVNLCKGVISLNNMKLKHLKHRKGVGVASFDLPAGYTCPMAYLCQTYSHKTSGKMTHGINAKFTCYASKAESCYPNTRLMRWSNFELTRDIESFVARINYILSFDKIGIMRIHSSGDFYNYAYFQTWTKITQENQNVTFFGYTKMAKFAKENQDSNQDNFRVVYSMGGKQDSYAIENNLQTCTVITPDMKINKNGTKFLNEVKTQYYGVNVWESIACEVESSDDFDFVMSGKSFGIILH